MTRQEQIIDAFRTVEFLTTSGQKTLMCGAANPEQLIRVLCDRPFDSMPVDELRRMAAKSRVEARAFGHHCCWLVEARCKKN